MIKFVEVNGKKIFPNKSVKVNKKGEILKKFSDNNWYSVVPVFHPTLKIYGVETTSIRPSLQNFTVVAESEEKAYEEAKSRMLHDEIEVKVYYLGEEYHLEMQ